MTGLDIARERLWNQGLTRLKFKEPAQVVRALGAVQAQDYAGARWALGLRLPDVTDPVIEQAFNNGAILRTHVMRPTWHFVAPEDIRWMLELTAPRVNAASAYMYRQLKLDDALFKRSNATIAKALQGGKQLTRAELALKLESAGINVSDSMRLGYIVSRAELDAVVCSGGRRGKQFTYALLEERAPKAKILKHEEALALLTERYFATRGPATLQDFVWWSGLTMADAKKGIKLVNAKFKQGDIEGQVYWFPEQAAPPMKKTPVAHLLPNYDEYFIGFKDRSAISYAMRKAKLDGQNPALLVHILIMNGQVVGGWRRTLKKDAVIVELSVLTKLTKAERDALVAATDRFGRFLNLPIVLTHAGPDDRVSGLGFKFE
jgi:hypothetical protein